MSASTDRTPATLTEQLNLSQSQSTAWWARARWTALWLALGLGLTACQSVRLPAAPLPMDTGLGARLDQCVRVMASPRSSARLRTEAETDYRGLLVSNLPRLVQETARPPRALTDRLRPPAGVPPGVSKGVPKGVLEPGGFAELVPARRPPAGVPGLHRDGLGLPLVGRIYPGGDQAPLAGFHVPLTLLVLPRDSGSGCCEAALVDPRRIDAVTTREGVLPVAMDLESPIDTTRATGPRFRDGLANLLRPDRLGGDARLGFLEPYDPDKTPVVLVHGLLSTPRMWAPVIKGLLADPRIRDHYQFWFFYYPTSKPIPVSARRLREALDAVAQRYPDRRPMILVGHSMGGILARAQVSRFSPEMAAEISPEIAALPESNPVRRSLVFEPRSDVLRVLFLFTPHRGSRLAVNTIGAWGMRLARLPQWLITEMAAYAHLFPDAVDGRLPTSIHGLSPHSQFLALLDRTRPTVPAHSIIGVRRGPAETGSDGVVAYRSAHLDSAESELVVRAGHSGVGHPDTIAELRRILISNLYGRRHT